MIVERVGKFKRCSPCDFPEGDLAAGCHVDVFQVFAGQNRPIDDFHWDILVIRRELQDDVPNWVGPRVQNFDLNRDQSAAKTPRTR